MARSALVVDDSDSMRRLVCQTLQGMGFTTLEASNGLEALIRVRDVKWLRRQGAGTGRTFLCGLTASNVSTVRCV
jgi:CheY-like chemotaxis protein